MSHKQSIPPEALNQHIAIVGKTGSGKTSTAKLAVEQVVAGGSRVCILDPIKSDWWGLISSADGRRAGLPFHILGGPRGHVPLHASAGKAIGEIVANGGLPLSIIDMAEFEPGGQSHFFKEFAPTLLKKMRGVVYLVIEEAHLFAPKERSGVGDENLSIHWSKMLATAGRSKGIRLIVLTQRTQALHNAMLGSCDTMIAHRLTAPADQEPVIKWLKANVEATIAAAVSSSLASLKTGEGWLCAGEAKIFERMHFPRIATYDNTATPTGDGSDHNVKTTVVDRDKLRAIIGDAVKEAEESDPRQLKKTIADLRRQLDAKPAAKVETRTIEKSVVTDKQVKSVESIVTRLEREGDRRIATADKLIETANELKASGADLKTTGREFAAALTRATQPVPLAVTAASVGTRVTMKPMPVSPIRRPAESDGTLPKGERVVLIALVQYPNGLEREQLTVLTGYKRSSRDSYIQRLGEKGFCGVDGGRITATREGIDALGGGFKPLPTGEALQQYWMQRLPEGERKILGVLIERHPDAVDRDALIEATGYQRSSRDSYIQRLKAKELVEIVGRGAVKASRNLFNTLAVAR